MVTITSNIGTLSAELQEKLRSLSNPELIPRQLAFDTIDLMTRRIHEEGRAADEGQIGTYSSGYLKLRERKYNRKSDTKIIVSLTRQLENDWSVIATDKGYGVGFNNSFNVQKARWVEETKDKAIFSLSPSEIKYATETIAEIITNALK